MISIITVYDSLNYGSYFQAHALEWELQKYDSVQFIDFHHQSIVKQTMVTCFKKIAKGKFADAALNYKKLRRFQKSQKTFTLVDIKDVEEDIVAFGSDEIWNISRKKILASKEFFGIDVPARVKVSVAPSINTSDETIFQENSYTIEGLKTFDYLSVRDKHSAKVLGGLLNMELPVVGDPTLLLTKEKLSSLEAPCKHENYILLYTYGKMLKGNVINDIKAFAKERDLKIISVGRWFSFCDENIAASPEEFLTLVKKAAYVFTDTFHGVMFSSIYEKQFIAFPCNNTKVTEVLADFNLSDRMKDDSRSLDEMCNNLIDYEVTNSFIEDRRVALKNYIDASIGSLY